MCGPLKLPHSSLQREKRRSGRAHLAKVTRIATKASSARIAQAQHRSGTVARAPRSTSSAAQPNSSSCDVAADLQHPEAKTFLLARGASQLQLLAQFKVQTHGVERERGRAATCRFTLATVQSSRENHMSNTAVEQYMFSCTPMACERS
jgi:hypothetical protein